MLYQLKSQLSFRFKINYIYSKFIKAKYEESLSLFSLEN